MAEPDAEKCEHDAGDVGDVLQHDGEETGILPVTHNLGDTAPRCDAPHGAESNDEGTAVEQRGERKHDVRWRWTAQLLRMNCVTDALEHRDATTHGEEIHRHDQRPEIDLLA